MPAGSEIKKHKQIKGEVFLLTTAIIWGYAFVVQKVAMDTIGPLTFTFARFLLGGILLIFVSKIFDNKQIKSGVRVKTDKKAVMVGGLVCGTVICFAANFQQVGIVTSTAGKAGFITALYIVLVPIFGLIIFKKRVTRLVWMAVFLAVIGLYFLFIKPGEFSVEMGDFLIFIGAFFWAAHILAVDWAVVKTDPIKLSSTQFIWAGLLSGVLMIILEEPSIPAILSCWFPILFSSVIVVGIAYTFQIIGQQTTDPTIASLLLSLESVFSVISGMLFLGERMTGRELFGCVLMFVAVVLTQLPEKSIRNGDYRASVGE